MAEGMIIIIISVLIKLFNKSSIITALELEAELEAEMVAEDIMIQEQMQQVTG